MPILNLNLLMTEDDSSFYEGNDMDHITFPVRVFKLLGVETMIGMSFGVSNNVEADHIGK